MNIRQIKSAVVGGPEIVGKWVCSVSKNGVHRYLHPEGKWLKYSHYFDTEAELRSSLETSEEPEFIETHWDHEGRRLIREDIEQGFDDLDYEGRWSGYYCDEV